METWGGSSSGEAHADSYCEVRQVPFVFQCLWVSDLLDIAAQWYNEGYIHDLHSLRPSPRDILPIHSYLANRVCGDFGHWQLQIKC